MHFACKFDEPKSEPISRASKQASQLASGQRTERWTNKTSSWGVSQVQVTRKARCARCVASECPVSKVPAEMALKICTSSSSASPTKTLPAACCLLLLFLVSIPYVFVAIVVSVIVVDCVRCRWLTFACLNMHFQLSAILLQRSTFCATFAIVSAASSRSCAVPPWVEVWGARAGIVPKWLASEGYAFRNSCLPKLLTSEQQHFDCFTFVCGCYCCSNYYVLLLPTMHSSGCTQWSSKLFELFIRK